MATSNAMYQRMASAYHALYVNESRPSLVLAHGGREMSDAFRHSIWQPLSEKSEDYGHDDKNASGEPGLLTRGKKRYLPKLVWAQLTNC